MKSVRLLYPPSHHDLPERMLVTDVPRVGELLSIRGWLLRVETVEHVLDVTRTEHLLEPRPGARGKPPASPQPVVITDAQHQIVLHLRFAKENP